MPFQTLITCFTCQSGLLNQSYWEECRQSPIFLIQHLYGRKSPWTWIVSVKSNLKHSGTNTVFWYSFFLFIILFYFIDFPDLRFLSRSDGPPNPMTLLMCPGNEAPKRWECGPVYVTGHNRKSTMTKLTTKTTSYVTSWRKYWLFSSPSTKEMHPFFFCKFYSSKLQMMSIRNSRNLFLFCVYAKPPWTLNMVLSDHLKKHPAQTGLARYMG